MSAQTGTGAIHALGNGHFLAYGRGIAVTGLIGPSYTAPSFGTLTPDGDARQWTTARVPHTGVWRHAAPDGSVLTDCVDPHRDVFCRAFSLNSPLRLRLTPGDGVTAHVLHDFAGADALGLRLPMGQNFFVSLATERERWLFAAGRSVALGDDGVLTLSGDGVLCLAAGLPPVAEPNLRDAKEGRDSLAAAMSDGQVFAARVRDLGSLLPAAVPDDLRRDASSAGEDVAFLIRAQQSAEGGIMAGHCYPMAYVRDMSGTVRGLLALGLYDEAKRAVRFWFERWQTFGDVRNAEAMGQRGGRLRFPNDCSEVPAYLIVTSFLVADRTGDDALLEEIWPMLRWAMDAQLPLLGHGMMPFSGDETYIAGGTLPRIHTCDGSAEASLLFWMGARRMLGYANARGLACPDAWTQAAEETERLYRENFLENGTLYCNAPARLQYRPKPPYIEGFCEAHDILHRELRLGWNRYDPQNGYYCCPDCCGQPLPPQTDLQTRYQLSSASLLPAFYGGSFLRPDETDAFLAPYAALFERYGFVPSNRDGSRSLGYDYGLFLAAVVRSERYATLHVPALRALLSVRDESGAWVEYYDGGVPAGCRCRPWESGLNVTALEALTRA